MLEVVQHQQHLPGAGGLETRQACCPAASGMPKGIGDGGGDERRVADRGKVDEPPVGEAVAQFGGDLQGEAGLADATGPVSVSKRTIASLAQHRPRPPRARDRSAGWGAPAGWSAQWSAVRDAVD